MEAIRNHENLTSAHLPEGTSGSGSAPAEMELVNEKEDGWNTVNISKKCRRHRLVSLKSR